MDSIEMLKLPSTAEAASVRAYLQAQATRDFSRAAEFFTDDIVFNDAMFPVSGREAVVTSLADYVKQFLTTFRVEAANEAGAPDRFLVLCVIAMRGEAHTMPTGELVSLRDGKICRVDNCFDVEKLKRLYCN